MTDGRVGGPTDLLSHTLTMWGGHIANLNGLDGWMDGRQTQGRMHGKIILLSHTFTARGSDVASLVEFCSSGLGGDSVTDRW